MLFTDSGRSVSRKTSPKVAEVRAFKTEGKVSLDTDLPRPVNK